MKDSEYWANKLKQKRLENSKNAERIVLGYESAKIKLNFITMYRMVESLSGHYWKKFIDHEGFTIGVLRERIYDDRETFIGVFQDFHAAGWKIHHEDISNPNACDPRAIRILETEGYNLYA